MPTPVRAFCLPATFFYLLSWWAHWFRLLFLPLRQHLVYRSINRSDTQMYKILLTVEKLWWMLYTQHFPSPLQISREIMQIVYTGISLFSSDCCPKIRVLHLVCRQPVNTQSQDTCLFYVCAEMGTRRSLHKASKPSVCQLSTFMHFKQWKSVFSLYITVCIYNHWLLHSLVSF